MSWYLFGRNSSSCLIATAIALVTSAIATSSYVGADDPVFSGPQVGEKLTPFKVLSVYGETAGTEVDPIKLASGEPTLLIFVHKLTRPGIALTRALTEYALGQKKNGVHTGIIWLDDDKAQAESYLTRAAGSLNFVVPVGISVDGGEGPGAYGLNRNVELTILVADDDQVKANYALVQPSVTEAAEIAAEVAKLVGQPAPKQSELEKLAYPRGMMRARVMKKDAEPTDDQAQAPGTILRTMMKELVARDASADSVKASIQSIEKWMADQPQRKTQLAKMAGAVLERGMGSEAVQQQLKKWQKLASESRPVTQPR
tara:strand:- start:55266 stop:56207 length:942 start_codon:yes stop_codon:yes gene_type:complete